MAAPSYEQVQSFGHVTEQLRQAAIDEFMGEMYEGITRDEVIEVAARIAAKFSMYGAELGAQWYDLCSQLAGFELEPAYTEPVDYERITARAEGAVKDVQTPADAQAVLNVFLQDLVNESIRTTGSANMWRDYERGLIPGKWSRVPVGDTCAWCIMLASQGAWYLTEKTALGDTPDHYHSNCNCIAVYHADAESIERYDRFNEYKTMYYDAENTRMSGDYSDEMRERIAAAKARHEKIEEQRAVEAEERGEEYTKRPWTVYNETLILMRDKNGVK